MLGYTAYGHVDAGERSKLDVKAKKMIFLGYPRGVKGYRMWDPLEKKVIVNRDVTFDEMSVLRRSSDMEEQEGELQVQQGNAGQLTQFYVLPPIGTVGRVDVQVEHTHKVPPQVERARTNDRG